jgi:hypothetical protein
MIFAKVENNEVVDVIVIEDRFTSEEEAQAFIRDECKIEGIWIHSSAERKNPAGIGMNYDPDRDAFIPQKPFPSWSLNEDTCQWESPTPRPEGIMYYWDEDALQWVERQ